MLTEEEILKYKEIYREIYGDLPSNEMILDSATKLIVLLEAVLSKK